MSDGCDNQGVLKDFEHRYRAVRGRDARFGGWLRETDTQES